MWPFKGKRWKNQQQAFSFVLVIMGLFIVLISLLDFFDNGKKIGLVFGGLLFGIGLLYFTEASS